MKITSEQVRDAMLSSGVEIVDHQECGHCGEKTFYSRMNDRLFFNAGCGCGWRSPEPRSWEDAAHWINLQSNDVCQQDLMERFGFSVKPKP